MDKNSELVLMAQTGDKKACEQILEDNSGLIWCVVRRFANRGAEMEDLYQLGSIGMLKAVKNFNPDFGVKFSTYAVPMIMGEIKRFLRDDGIIKISRSVKELSVKINQLKQELTKAGSEEPSINELAEKLNVTSEEIIVALEASMEIESLNTVVYQGDNSEITLMDKIPQESRDNQLVENIDLKNALLQLEDRERKIIKLRYFQDKTQAQVAEIIGVSQVQISRIEKKVLGYMRKLVE